MIETITSSAEFEQNPSREIERKYVPLFPSSLIDLREKAMPIEQFYLSHPREDFSLRFRETFKNGELRYMATLKDRGTITDQGLDRLEVEVEVSPELYRYYKSPDIPYLRKFRTAMNNHVAIDFYDDGYVQLEAEDPIAWTQFTEQHGSHFVEVTGDKSADNEWLAHLDYRRQNEGEEALVPQADLDVDVVAMEIAQAYMKSPSVVVQLCGRSGSGKSTIVRAVQAKLSGWNIASTVLSTDDYHRGASWLRAHNSGQEWSEWDHPVVYDTATMAQDLQRLKAGEVIQRRTIDFGPCEPVYDGEVRPQPIIIVEGIYAASPDFNDFDTLRYNIPTPLATCIGRRLLRDLKERPEFANPEKSLKYMLEQAEPAWRKQSE